MKLPISPGWLLAGGVAGAGIYWATRSTDDGSGRQMEGGRFGPRVVILGGGFAGLAAADALDRWMGSGCRITLVDQHNYHLFTPLLFQVASSDIGPYDVAYPLRQHTAPRGIDYRMGVVQGVDLDHREVKLEDSSLGYDYLVIALGTTTNFFGNDSARRHALPLKWLEEAVAVRNRIIDALERAAVTDDPAERSRLLTFVVVGGGATGVETAAAMTDLLRRTVRMDYPGIGRDEPRVVLVEAGRKLLGHMGDPVADVAIHRLEEMGVEVWLSSEASHITPEELQTRDGRKIPTRTAIWATGVRVPGVVESVPAAHGKGGSLVVDEYLRLEGRHEVFAAGDNAHVADPQTGDAVPLLAQAAIQEGRAAGENLARTMEGVPLIPFRYRSLGNAISLGRSDGVVEAGGFLLDGALGGLAWRAIHLLRAPSARNRLATTLNWLFSYAYQRDVARLELRPSRAGASQSGVASRE